MGILARTLFTKAAATTASGSQSIFAEAMARMWGAMPGRKFTPLFGASVWSGADTIPFELAAQQGYRSIVWVRVCIDKIGKAIATPQWEVVDKSTKKVIPNHELANLINAPNPFQTRRAFFTAATAYLKLAGNVYTEKVIIDSLVNKRKLVSELWLHRPDLIAPIPDTREFISGYLLQPRYGERKEIDKNRIMHMMYPDPLNPYVGLSPIASAHRSVTTSTSAATWNQAMLDNYAIPSGVLSTDKTLVPADRISLKEEVLQEYTDKERFSPMVLWGGLKWQQLTLPHSEMQFMEQAAENTKEFCAVLGCPAIVAGAEISPTYANYKEARLAFWEDEIIPDLEWWKVTFEQHLIKPYYGDEIELRYNLNNIPALREATARKVTIGLTMQDLGYTRNEINQQLELSIEDDESGETRFVRNSLTPQVDYEAMLPDARPGEGNQPDAGDEMDDMEEEGGPPAPPAKPPKGSKPAPKDSGDVVADADTEDV